MNFKKWTGIALACTLIGSLGAQPREVDRQRETEEFPDLQHTELLQDRNIADAYQRLGTLGWLVSMAEADRGFAAAEREDLENSNFDFRNTFRFIQYTPRNTYIRFVTENQNALLNTFYGTTGGADDPLFAEVKTKVDRAKAVGIQANEIDFSQNRRGIELTQYDFIYANDRDARRAVGSRRKSVTLFFSPSNAQADTEQQGRLTMVVTRITEDNFRAGIRTVQLIIDPTPDLGWTNEQPPNTDDVLILHRYNEKPSTCVVVGAMHNTTTNPHRARFKQQFYVKLLDHFWRLYSMVANYASKDDNDYNEEVLQKLEQSMSY